MTLVDIIVGLLVLAVIGSIIALTVRDSPETGTKALSPAMKSNRSSIDPKPFHTGYIQNPPPQQKIADACNGSMYPVQPPYVDYGNVFSTAAANSRSCDVNIFNSPP